ncbi:10236_t:CDS:2, partial [Racocetra fulgida]
MQIITKVEETNQQSVQKAIQASDLESQIETSRDCDKLKDLNQCMLLCYDLEQYELKNSPGSRIQAIKKSNKSKKEIKKRQEKLEKDLEFKEQEIGIAIKRRAIAIHCIKVLKSYPDNGSDIQK